MERNIIKTRLNQKRSLEQTFNAMVFRKKLQKTLFTGYKTIFVTLCSGSLMCLCYYNIFLRDFLRKKSSEFQKQSRYLKLCINLVQYFVSTKRKLLSFFPFLIRMRSLDKYRPPLWKMYSFCYLTEILQRSLLKNLKSKSCNTSKF